MEQARDLSDTDQLVELGIKILGPTTLLTVLVLRWGRWNARRVAQAPGPYAGLPPGSATAE